MTQRLTRRQRMRGSQSSQPRHNPDVTGLFPRDLDASYQEPNYILSSIPSEYSSQGHVSDFPWGHPGHGHSPDGDASLTTHREYPPSSMADYEQHPLSHPA